MKNAVKVFQTAEDAIQEYRNKILNIKNMIEDHLRFGKPLPKDLREILVNPNSTDNLRISVRVLDYVAEGLLKKLYRMRYFLAQCNVVDALLIAESLTRDVFNNLANVFGEYPYESELLPPSYNFFRIINDETKKIFPRNLDSPLETEEKRDFANYLRNVDNPWTKYAKP
ncbi:hypothetical protein [Thalassospira sp. TSL5-1]|uniref:hypothetical protein n=1 Tax=Thalassospira sp. TSL5-1 TaxID=1544451 RepID=UPI00093DA005|nr:hypothetical protein [Thalassospira sp. TSL5-1]OKH90122.1 hypothetical protein LF95_09645 [Thalassospira sp. TSL5-1]